MADYIALLNRIERLDFVILPPIKPAKVPCPICHSTEYLVEGFGHYRVLVCDRPTCTYARAKARVNFRPRLVTKGVK